MMHRLWMLVLALALSVACAPAASPSPTSAPAKPAEAPAKEAAKPAEKAAPTTAPAKPAATQPAAKAAAIPPDYFTDKTIRVIVGYAPGSSSDQRARYLAQEWPKFTPANPRMIGTSPPGASAIIAAT